MRKFAGDGERQHHDDHTNHRTAVLINTSSLPHMKPIYEPPSQNLIQEYYADHDLHWCHHEDKQKVTTLDNVFQILWQMH
jgi:hypothetical protein